jgi:hypothetical protein
MDTHDIAHVGRFRGAAAEEHGDMDTVNSYVVVDETSPEDVPELYLGKIRQLGTVALAPDVELDLLLIESGRIVQQMPVSTARSQVCNEMPGYIFDTDLLRTGDSHSVWMEIACVQPNNVVLVPSKLLLGGITRNILFVCLLARGNMGPDISISSHRS